METQRSSLELFHLKQMLKHLRKKQSVNNSTSLVTLYIPPTSQLSEFASLLRNEYGTASNIKDKKTGKAVMDAIQSILARLPNYENTENGLVIFAGQTADRGKVEFYAIHPPEKVGIKTYRCESFFDTRHLEEMLDHKEQIGIIVIDRSGAIFALIRGNELKIVKEHDSFVPSKHGRGGQSAQRIERGIEILAQEFFGKMAEEANSLFLESFEVKYILVGGTGMSKNEFIEHKKLDPRIREKIYKVYDLGYGGETGIRELLERAKDDIGDIELIKEKKLVDEFLRRLAKDSDKVTYGEEAVRKALQMAAVEVVLYSETVDKTFFWLECTNCGHTKVINGDSEKALSIGLEVGEMPCESCGNTTYEIIKEEELIDEFERMAKDTGATIEVISANHEGGAMLANNFTGVAALLRYAVSI